MKYTIANKLKSTIALTLILVFVNCIGDAQTRSDRPGKDKKKIQLALLLDTSNSMDGLIEQAKSQLWSIVNELAKAKCDNTLPDLQIALYEYGNDNLPMSEGYIRLVTPLTSDLDEISKDLFELTTNGGDEFCGQVIASSLKRLDWSSSDKDLKLIFIAGNEPFTQGKINYKTVCTNAKEKGVVVNTIFCGNFDEGIRTAWKDGAVITGGKYFSIEQNRKTVYIPSPYDDRITKLNSLLNETYIPYGHKGRQKKANQSAQDANAMSYGAANTVQRAVSKSSRVYKNKSWDLVDAAEEEEFDVAEIAEEQLPAEMKGMDDKEKLEFIEKNKAERNEIQKEIRELNAKRVQYIAEHKKENNSEGMLDNAILMAIQEQAKAKNYVIE